VQKTQERDVVVLDFGKLTFNETVKYCPVCEDVFGSEKLKALVPDYCKFGFDVIEFIGKKLFVEHHTENEALIALKERNVQISPRGISCLGEKFIAYLARAHKDKEAEVRGESTEVGKRSLRRFFR